MEHDTYRVGMLVLRFAGHGLIISLVIYDLVGSPVCDIKQVLKGQTHGDGAYGCAVQSKPSEDNHLDAIPLLPCMTFSPTVSF